MEGAHPHLLLNHFPPIGSIFSILLLLAGAVLKNDIINKTALAMIVLTSLVTIPAFLTGEDAEETLKSINQDPHDIIHEHEEMGEKGLWTTLGVGTIAAFALFTRKKNRFRKLLPLTFLALLLNTVFLFKISNAGGKIRHTEIRETVNDPH
jgi:hypothetical protein